VLAAVVLGLLIEGYEGRGVCSHPQGKEGDSLTEGCLKRTCKGGVWRTSLESSVCCYEGKAYPTDTILSTTMSEDHCVKASIECKEDGGKARMTLGMENFCADYATQEQVEEIKDLLVKAFEPNCETADHESSEPTKVVLRLGTELSGGWSVGDSRVDAIDFVPSKDIKIKGISLHRSHIGSAHYKGLFRLKENPTKRVIATGNFDFTTDDSKTYIDKMFSSPASVTAGVMYTIDLEYGMGGIGGDHPVWDGVDGKSSVSVGCGGETVTFQFSNADESNNFSNVDGGQIPRILFSC